MRVLIEITTVELTVLPARELAVSFGEPSSSILALGAIGAVLSPRPSTSHLTRAGTSPRSGGIFSDEIRSIVEVQAESREPRIGHALERLSVSCAIRGTDASRRMRLSARAPTTAMNVR